eukprot:scpid98628/ scgid30565/ 
MVNSQFGFFSIRWRIPETDGRTLGSGSVEKMAGHAQSLSLLCRIGGVKLSKAKQSTSYAVDSHASGIQKAFGVHVGNDQLDVHPKPECVACATKQYAGA